MRQVLVVGAQGVLGSFLARRFAADGWEVTRAGRRPEDADDFRLLDLADREAVEAAVAGASLIVNMARNPALHLEREVLRKGGILLELSDLSPLERAALREEEGGGGGLVVTDAGLSGVSYLALADLLSDHPEADEAHCLLMFSATGSSGRAGALLGHRILTESRHHARKKVQLPEPWGSQRAFAIAPRDSGPLITSIAGSPLRHYLTMEPRPLRGFLGALNGTRLISFLPGATFTAGVGKVPDKPSEEPICEWVGVTSGGEPLAERTIQGKGYYAMTASAVITFAETLAGRAQPEYGVHGLEDVIALPEIAGALGRRGISVETAGSAIGQDAVS